MANREANGKSSRAFSEGLMAGNSNSAAIATDKTFCQLSFKDKARDMFAKALNAKMQVLGKPKSSPVAEETTAPAVTFQNKARDMFAKAIHSKKAALKVHVKKQLVKQKINSDIVRQRCRFKVQSYVKDKMKQLSEKKESEVKKNKKMSLAELQHTIETATADELFNLFEPSLSLVKLDVPSTVSVNDIENVIVDSIISLDTDALRLGFVSHDVLSRVGKELLLLNKLCTARQSLIKRQNIFEAMGKTSADGYNEGEDSLEDVTEHMSAQEDGNEGTSEDKIVIDTGVQIYVFADQLTQSALGVIKSEPCENNEGDTVPPGVALPHLNEDDGGSMSDSFGCHESITVNGVSPQQQEMIGILADPLLLAERLESCDEDSSLKLETSSYDVHSRYTEQKAFRSVFDLAKDNRLFDESSNSNSPHMGQKEHSFNLNTPSTNESDRDSKSKTRVKLDAKCFYKKMKSSLRNVLKPPEVKLETADDESILGDLSSKSVEETEAVAKCMKELSSVEETHVVKHEKEDLSSVEETPVETHSTSIAAPLVAGDAKFDSVEESGETVVEDGTADVLEGNSVVQSCENSSEILSSDLASEDSLSKYGSVENKDFSHVSKNTLSPSSCDSVEVEAESTVDTTIVPKQESSHLDDLIKKMSNRVAPLECSLSEAGADGQMCSDDESDEDDESSAESSSLSSSEEDSEDDEESDGEEEEEFDDDGDDVSKSESAAGSKSAEGSLIGTNTGISKIPNKSNSSVGRVDADKSDECTSGVEGIPCQVSAQGQLGLSTCSNGHEASSSVNTTEALEAEESESSLERSLMDVRNDKEFKGEHGPQIETSESNSGRIEENENLVVGGDVPMKPSVEHMDDKKCISDSCDIDIKPCSSDVRLSLKVTDSCRDLKADGEDTAAGKTSERSEDVFEKLNIMMNRVLSHEGDTIDTVPDAMCHASTVGEKMSGNPMNKIYVNVKKESNSEDVTPDEDDSLNNQERSGGRAVLQLQSRYVKGPKGEGPDGLRPVKVIASTLEGMDRQQNKDGKLCIDVNSLSVQSCLRELAKQEFVTVCTSSGGHGALLSDSNKCIEDSSVLSSQNGPFESESSTPSASNIDSLANMKVSKQDTARDCASSEVMKDDQETTMSDSKADEEMSDISSSTITLGYGSSDDTGIDMDNGSTSVHGKQEAANESESSKVMNEGAEAPPSDPKVKEELCQSSEGVQPVTDCSLQIDYTSVVSLSGKEDPTLLNRKALSLASCSTALSSLQMFEKNSQGEKKKSAFISEELDNYLDSAENLGVEVTGLRGCLKEKEKKSSSHIIPDIDEIEGLPILSFTSEALLKAHISIDQSKQIACGLADLKSLCDNKNQDRRSEYVELMQAKASQTKTTQRSTSSKDIKRIKQLQEKFDLKDAAMHLTKLHWKTEESLLKQLSPSEFKSIGLNIRRKRRKNLTFTHRKSNSQSRQEAKGRSLFSHPLLKGKSFERSFETEIKKGCGGKPEVNAKVPDTSLNKFKANFKKLQNTFKNPSLYTRPVQTPELTVRISRERAEIAVQALKLDLIQCDLPGCAFGCICHLMAPSTDGDNEPAVEQATSTGSDGTCLNEFCRMGCVCDSLNSAGGVTREKALRQHCGRPDCMLECQCVHSNLRSKYTTIRHLLNGSNEDQAHRRRGRACGKCYNCVTSEDCDLCRYCLDKPRNGGKNILKQGCIRKKRCVYLQNPRGASGDDGSECPEPASGTISVPASQIKILTSFSKNAPTAKRQRPPKVYDEMLFYSKMEDLMPKAKKVKTTKSKSAKPSKKTRPETSSWKKPLTPPLKTPSAQGHLPINSFLTYTCARIRPFDWSNRKCQVGCNCTKDHDGEKKAEDTDTTSVAHDKKVQSDEQNVDKEPSSLPKNGGKLVTQMMLLQRTSKKTETASPLPYLLEVTSAHIWVSIRQNLFGIVTRLADMRNGYPDPCTVTIGGFKVEVKPPASTPVLVPRHLQQGGLPSLMYSIRVKITLATKRRQPPEHQQVKEVIEPRTASQLLAREKALLATHTASVPPGKQSSTNEFEITDKNPSSCHAVSADTLTPIQSNSDGMSKLGQSKSGSNNISSAGQLGISGLAGIRLVNTPNEVNNLSSTSTGIRRAEIQGNRVKENRTGTGENTAPADHAKTKVDTEIGNRNGDNNSSVSPTKCMPEDKSPVTTAVVCQVSAENKETMTEAGLIEKDKNVGTSSSAGPSTVDQYGKENSSITPSFNQDNCSTANAGDYRDPAKSQATSLTYAKPHPPSSQPDSNQSLNSLAQLPATEPPINLVSVPVLLHPVIKNPDGSVTSSKLVVPGDVLIRPNGTLPAGCVPTGPPRLPTADQIKTALMGLRSQSLNSVLQKPTLLLTNTTSVHAPVAGSRSLLGSSQSIATAGSAAVPATIAPVNTLLSTCSQVSISAASIVSTTLPPTFVGVTNSSVVTSAGLAVNTNPVPGESVMTTLAEVSLMHSTAVSTTTDCLITSSAGTMFPGQTLNKYNNSLISSSSTNAPVISCPVRMIINSPSTPPRPATVTSSQAAVVPSPTSGPAALLPPKSYLVVQQLNQKYMLLPNQQGVWAGTKQSTTGQEYQVVSLQSQTSGTESGQPLNTAAATVSSTQESLAMSGAGPVTSSNVATSPNNTRSLKRKHKDSASKRSPAKVKKNRVVGQDPWNERADFKWLTEGKSTWSGGLNKREETGSTSGAEGVDGSMVKCGDITATGEVNDTNEARVVEGSDGSVFTCGDITATGGLNDTNEASVVEGSDGSVFTYGDITVTVNKDSSDSETDDIVVEKEIHMRKSEGESCMMTGEVNSVQSVISDDDDCFIVGEEKPSKQLSKTDGESSDMADVQPVNSDCASYVAVGDGTHDRKSATKAGESCTAVSQTVSVDNEASKNGEGIVKIDQVKTTIAKNVDGEGLAESNELIINEDVDRSSQDIKKQEIEEHDDTVSKQKESINCGIQLESCDAGDGVVRNSHASPPTSQLMTKSVQLSSPIGQTVGRAVAADVEVNTTCETKPRVVVEGCDAVAPPSGQPSCPQGNKECDNDQGRCRGNIDVGSSGCQSGSMKQMDSLSESENESVDVETVTESADEDEVDVLSTSKSPDSIAVQLRLSGHANPQSPSCSVHNVSKRKRKRKATVVNHLPEPEVEYREELVVHSATPPPGRLHQAHRYREQQRRRDMRYLAHFLKKEVYTEFHDSFSLSRVVQDATNLINNLDKDQKKMMEIKEELLKENVRLSDKLKNLQEKRKREKLEALKGISDEVVVALNVNDASSVCETPSTSIINDNSIVSSDVGQAVTDNMDVSCVIEVDENDVNDVEIDGSFDLDCCLDI